MESFIVIVTLLQIVCTITVVAFGQPTMEQRLKRHLFPVTFDPSVRPVEDHTMNVTVFIDMTLNHLVDMNEQLQILQSEIWIRLKWTDPQLLWEPAEFGNISVVHVSVGRIWRPDIVVYNDVGLETGKDPKDFLLSIKSSGLVQWLYPRTIETSCKIDVTYFPYDSQKCVFKFGSWAYQGNLLDVRHISERGDSSHYVDNGEWMLSGITAERHERYYECCPEPFPDVTFTLELQRRCLYYVFNLTVPCILITLLHLTTFMLPAESGEKISLNVTILLGLTVFQLLVAELMPPQSEVMPMISQYFGMCIILVSLSTALSVLILHLHFRGSRGFPVPPMLRSVIMEKLGCVLCYGRLVKQASSKKMANDLQAKKSTKGVNASTNEKVELLSVLSLPVTSNGTALPSEEHQKRAQRRNYVYREGALTPRHEGPPLIEDLGVLHRHLEDKEEAEKAIIHDWVLVSLILDRFFLVVLSIADISATIFILRPVFYSATWS